MAHVSDIRLIRSIGVFRFAIRIWDEVRDDNLIVWASAMAYSWIFAIFPFLIFLLVLIPYLPQQVRERARAELKREVASKFPAGANGMLWQDLAENPHNLIHHNSIRDPMAWIGLCVAVWVASSGMSRTMAALDRCYDLENARPFWKQRLIALGLTIVVAVLLLAVMCLLPLATWMRHWAISEEPMTALPVRVSFEIARWVISLGLMTCILAIIYYFGPAVRFPFSFVTPGAIFVVLVWVGLGLSFRVYMERIGAAGFTRLYGALGGVAIMLLFFFIDALVLLIGAEINAELDFAAKRTRPPGK